MLNFGLSALFDLNQFLVSRTQPSREGIQDEVPCFHRRPMELNTTTQSTTLIITSMLVCSPSLKVLMTPSTSECPRVDTFEAEHVEVALFVLKFEERIIRPKNPTIHCYVTIGRFCSFNFKASTNVGESLYPMIGFYGKYA
jgi:hypothetical protein